MKIKRLKILFYGLDKNGWEVGLHGSYNSFNNYALMKSEKQFLENILNHKVIGIRQHHLQIGEKTWEIQKECGFKYDSSLGFNEKIGFKNKQYKFFSPVK